MLFNSLVFVFGFLPASLIVFYALGAWRPWTGKFALVIATLAFYAGGHVRDVPVLVGSVIFNWVVGHLILRARAARADRRAGLWTTFGVLANLALLGWFKYADFASANIGALVGHIGLPPIALPLGISFFTFVNIAWLIDASRGRAGPVDPLDFALFTGFFPKLISGPVVRFSEFVPQLRRRLFGRLIWRNLLVGLVIFAIGLFKKTVIADSLATWVNPFFEGVGKGQAPGSEAAWLAVAGYTLQLYFDFSGYSDMAIGIGRMFGLKLPINFHSPLRAQGIIEYWRRWNMTLQKLIVSYVFDPLSLPLNRLAAGAGLRGWADFAVTNATPIFLAFIAVGIWHGAGWAFVVFGAMHGMYVVANEAWRERGRQRKRRLRRAGRTVPDPGAAERAAYHLLTLAAVMLANVAFRAATLSRAAPIWAAMFGFGAPAAAYFPDAGVVATLVVGWGLVALAPNAQQIMSRFDPAWNWADWRDVGRAPIAWTWTPNLAGVLFVAAALFFGVMFIQRGPAVFLYFKF